MEPVWIVQAVITAFAIVIWFLFRDLKGKIDKIQEDFLNYKTHVAENFITQPQLARAIEALNKTIEGVASGVARIEERLYKSHQDKSE